LAAILAGDVVGYSRLMGADEVGTLRALKAIRRELADPAIAAHHGRVVKIAGESIPVCGLRHPCCSKPFGRGNGRKHMTR
jgi:adenylate cyclase